MKPRIARRVAVVVVRAVAAVAHAVAVAVAAAAVQAGTDPYSGTSFRDYLKHNRVSRNAGHSHWRAWLSPAEGGADTPQTGSLHQIAALPQSLPTTHAALPGISGTNRKPS
jgi:hypothetical protein